MSVLNFTILTFYSLLSKDKPNSEYLVYSLVFTKKIDELFLTIESITIKYVMHVLCSGDFTYECLTHDND